jgi:hypothetical protein
VEPVLDRGDPAERRLDDFVSACLSPSQHPPQHVPGEVAELGQGSGLLFDDPGHLEPAVLDLGGVRQSLLLSEAGLGFVRSHHVGSRDGMGGWGDVLGSDLTDPLGVLEDEPKLTPEPFPLLPGQGQASELGNMIDVDFDRHEDGV